MAGISGPDVAVAVAKAGGLGLIGAGYIEPDRLTSMYDAALQQLSSTAEAHGAVGFGLINFACSQELLQTIINFKPRAIWLSFGEWEDLAVPINKAGIKLICQIQHLEQVEPALHAGADVIVGQGSEAGGHGASPASLLTLIPELMDHVERVCLKLGICPAVPVAAAGGITDARQMAAAFALGASGVVLGTRLCATHESLLPEAKKQALIEAGYSSSCNPSTLRTTLYDELGTVPWPPDIDGRCLKNQFTAVYSSQTPLQSGVKKHAKEEYDEANAHKLVNKQVVWCGSGVGLIHRIEYAEDLVNDLVKETMLIFQKNIAFATTNDFG
ncbi:MAG: hypothetical protein FRX49_07010 [Trebouxia sp. A1-2]|nr:MAG: hypothetical protein FRX49_07010 [Trebouxia sp. A1-2]